MEAASKQPSEYASGVPIIKFKTSYPSYFLAACLVAFVGLMLMNKAAIAKQLDDWQVLPKPQRLSELYFTSASRLPTSVKPGANQKLAFTVHNIEHRTTLYRYRLLAVSSDGKAARLLEDGAITLNHDQSKNVALVASLPSIGSQVAIKVELEYEAVQPGGVLGLQKQSIHHWVHMTGLRS